MCEDDQMTVYISVTVSVGEKGKRQAQVSPVRLGGNYKPGRCSLISVPFWGNWGREQSSCRLLAGRHEVWQWDGGEEVVL